MTLQKRLLHVLNDNDEPLVKRLKIADNTFKSDININNKYMFLLKWGSKVSLQQCYYWLSSDCFRELYISDVQVEDIQVFIEAISKQCENCTDQETLDVLLMVIGSVIDSSVFQYYFRKNVVEYLHLLLKAINKIKNADAIIKLLRNERIFGKKIIVAPDFSKHFMTHLFPAFVKLCAKLENPEVFELVTLVLQRHVFSKTINFEEIIENVHTNNEILDDLLPKLMKPKKRILYQHYKLIFHGFCKTNKSNANLQFGFFVFLLRNIGFSYKNVPPIENENSTELDDSLHVLVALLEVVAENSMGTAKLESPNAVTLPELIQYLLTTIIDGTKAPINVDCYKLINLMIKISPLAIEAEITLVLKYVMFYDNEDHTDLYAQVLSNVFDVFNKLHRVQTLISKLIRALQPVYVNVEGVDTNVDAVLVLDVEKLLPQVFLEKFSSCLPSLASWQLANLFKTFIFNLDELIGSDLAEKSKSKAYVTFIETISKLLCQFQSKMNISASHFRTGVVEKFTKVMNEQEKVLEKFGNALVEIEHNQHLIRVFLNLSYTLGELKILLNYTLTTSNPIEEALEIDVTTCNIAYLHSYLPTHVWCVIAERISNFGELPCKEIMEKLWIQKVRALILADTDRTTISEHISSLIKTITPVEEYYKYLTSNAFAINAVVSEMDMNSLIAMAECTIRDIASHENQEIFSSISGNKNFTVAILCCVVKKLHKMLKKLNEPLMSCSIYSHIVVNFIDFNEESTILSKEICKQSIYKPVSSSGIDKALNVSTDKLIRYLAIIKELPIVHLDEQHQKLLFVYLFSVLHDLKRHGCESGSVLEDIETIIMGITQTQVVKLEEVLDTKAILQVVINNFKHYQQMFVYLLESTVSVANNTHVLWKCIDYLTKHLKDYKHLKCFLIFLKYIQNKKSKHEELKQILQQEKIYSLLLAMITTSNSEGSPALEVLVTLLEIYPKENLAENTIGQLIKHLDVVFSNKSVRIDKGELSLFQFILQRRIPQDECDEKAFICKIGATFPRVILHEDLIGTYSSVVLIILQSIEDLSGFKAIIDEILKQTVTNQQQEDMMLRIQVWYQILTCSFKPEKGDVLQKAIGTLMLKLTEVLEVPHEAEHGFNVLMDFQLQLLQNTHLLLTSTCLDLCFATITKRMSNVDTAAFQNNFVQCVNLLEALLKYRQALICDRLPNFLQQYRILLRCLCKNSDTTRKFNDDEFEKMAECAHLLEKLTINLSKLKMHVASVAIYLIADILQEYERISMYPAVKMALNKCMYVLLSMCSPHGIACLMRVLSPGSTEIFKGTYDSYKRYHRFTGKV